jgi:glycosyltransferase involved in cell wall biosynthesis
VFRVLQISNKAPFPANDGSSIAIYNMAKGLIDNKVDLHLLTINTKKHFKADELVPKDFRKNSNYLSVYRNTNTGFFGAFLNLFSSGSYFVSRFYFKAFENKLIEILKKKSFDIVQLEGLFMGVYIKTIKKYSQAKIVLRAHNVEHQIWTRHIANESFSIKKIYLTLQNNRLKKFELKVLSEVDAVVPITDRDKKELIDLGFKKPIFTCITGVDVKSYRIPHELNHRAKTIFYFGSMDWLPNQEAANWFLNNCWDKIHKAVPEAKFIIAGRGMPLEFFHISRPNVLIIENVENGQAFYQQHELMVVPLWSGSGLRIKIIEGMAYGKAIVSTSIGAEGIPFTDGKNIIIADTADGFSNAVINLLLNDFKKKELEKNASELALNEFDNFKVISRLNEFYKELLHA